jgi:hypothetical protein
MTKTVLFSILVTTFATACSSPDGGAPASAEAPTAALHEALAAGTYDCSTLTKNAFGAATDTYDPTNASSPTTLYAFLNAAVSANARDLQNALSDGGTDYSTTATRARDDLKAAHDKLDVLVSFMTSTGYDGTNASTAYNIAGYMNPVIYELSEAALLSSISAITNTPTTGANNGSYAQLYARKALELANQAGYRGEYCYESSYSRQIPNAESLPGLACAGVP